MDFWVISAIVIGALIFIFFIYGLLQKRKWRVEEVRHIDAKPGQLFNYLNELKHWEDWTAWNRESKEKYRYSYEGPAVGRGAVQQWTTKKQRGFIKLTGSVPGKQIDFKFGFGKGQNSTEGSIEIDPEKGGSKITWYMTGDAGESPSGRIMAKMMQPYMQRDFKIGLDRLEKIAAGWDDSSFAAEQPAED